MSLSFVDFVSRLYSTVVSWLPKLCDTTLFSGLSYMAIKQLLSRSDHRGLYKHVEVIVEQSHLIFGLVVHLLVYRWYQPA